MSPTDNHAGSAAFAWLYRAALILIFAWLGYACLFGIANYWQWGHDGFNGAAFFNAARNAIKFHILGQAQYYFGDAPPPPDAIYTHHPLLLQLLLIKNFLVFGDHEWAGRLVPAFYSFATGALIYHSARLWYGHWHALFALAIYALTPLNLIFAHMINHEQLGIFWCLGTLHLFLSWFKTPTKLLMCAWLLAATLAVHSDWPGYYVCFYQALFLIAAYVATREQRGMRFVALLALSVVTLANLALFFTWIIQVKGGLNEMFGAYTLRTQALPLREYLKQQYTRSLELHGTWIHVLFAAWLANIIWRTLKRKLTLADALPLTFLFVQLLHSYLFKQAAFIHSYWLYYLSPAIAYGGADVIVRTTRQASERLRISAWAPITVFVLMVAATWPFAYHQLLWGARSGTASFVSPYNDQHDLAMWFKHMTRVLKRRIIRETNRRYFETKGTFSLGSALYCS